MKQLRFRFVYFLALFLLYQVKRKLTISSEALYFLRDHADDGINFEGSQELKIVLEKVKEPAVLLLNKHALNITLNFLCNLNNFPSALENVVTFAFDPESSFALSKAFPHVHTLAWPLKALEDRFTASDGRYQLFQYFRARLCKFLASKVPSFWMIQADTIWRGNFFDLVDSEVLKTHDIVFDSEGSEGLLRKMIAGGYFHVNGNERSEAFFEEISETLLNYYATDNNLFGKLCLEKFGGIDCGRFLYNHIVNWRWRRPDSYTPSDLPILFQFDGGDGAESKLHAMQRLGAAFLDFDSLDPNLPSPIQCYQKPLKNGILTENRFFESSDTQKANIVIRVFHNLFELINASIPGVEFLILSKLFPFWAYYLVI